MLQEKRTPEQSLLCSGVVQERRLELPRRLPHAPQTCLSTYSNTLAADLQLDYYKGTRLILSTAFSAKSQGLLNLLFCRAWGGWLPLEAAPYASREQTGATVPPVGALSRQRSPGLSLMTLGLPKRLFEAAPFRRGKVRDTRNFDMAQSVLAWSHSSSIRWFTEAGRKRKLVPFGKGLFAGVGHFAGYHLPGP